MMIALGCIQALECNRNSCPTGVATQDPELVAGLVVKDKKQRIANYQRETVKSYVELLAAAGLHNSDEVTREHVYRRISMIEYQQYSDIFPYVEQGSLLNEKTVPEHLLKYWKKADPDRF